MAGLCEIARLNSKYSNYYLNIVGNSGKIYDGGDQGWWEDKVTISDSMDKDDRLSIIGYKIWVVERLQ